MQNQRLKARNSNVNGLNEDGIINILF